MKIKALFCRCLPPNSPINPILRNLPPSTFFSKDVRKLPPLPISTTKTKETYLLAWGTLSTQGNMILSGVVCVSSVRPSVCPSVVTNRVTGQNLRTEIGISLLFFLIDWYEWEGVQSKKKFCAPRGNSPRETFFCVFFTKKSIISERSQIWTYIFF